MTSLPVLPAIVESQVHHQRYGVGAHDFTHQHVTWLIDLDQPHPLPRGARFLAKFSPSDHLDEGRLGDGIRGDLTRFLDARGIQRTPGDRLLMLAQPRFLGQVFNPLTVFWLVAADGTPRVAVLEVHNTYGGRHAYLVPLDGPRPEPVPKAFYVSPFNDVSGSYAVRLLLDPERIAVSIELSRDDQPVLTAALAGTPEPATPGKAVAAAVLRPWHNLKVPVLIRWHGIRLWAGRELVIQPRPRDAADVVR